MHPPLLPYALPVPEFRFRALAALVGRAPLGGEREAALGVLMAARLACSALSPWPPPVPQVARAKRGAAARGWFASLAVQPTLRHALLRVVDASSGSDDGLAAEAVRALASAAAPFLDAASTRELAALADGFGAGGAPAGPLPAEPLPAEPRPAARAAAGGRRRAEQPA